MTTQKQIDDDFDRLLVDSLCATVKAIRELPPSRLTVPLILLERRLRWALEAYELSKEEP